MRNRLLVAFDGSEQSYKALDFAIDMAKLCPDVTSEVLVLAVAQPPEPIDIVEVKAIIIAFVFLPSIAGGLAC